MKTKYHLEIFEPDDPTTLVAHYESDYPFGAISIGDLIGNGGNMGPNERLKVKCVEHLFWEIKGSHISHKISVHTEKCEDWLSTI